MGDENDMPMQNTLDPRNGKRTFILRLNIN